MRILKKIWLVILPCIIVVNLGLAISNLITTRSNNLMLLEIIDKYFEKQ
jgi:hypothetical protein